jgi:hypothetical protein
MAVFEVVAQGFRLGARSVVKTVEVEGEIF